MASMKYELLHGVLAKIGAGEPMFVFRAGDPISLQIVLLYSAMLGMAIKALGDGNEKERLYLQAKMISCNAVADAMKKYKPDSDAELPAVDLLRVTDLLSGEYEVTFKKRTNQ